MIAYASGADVAVDFMDSINDVILFPLITLLITIALVVFLYGCFQFVLGSSNEQAREKGKSHIMYGIIGMLVMLSAYAILSIATATFGIEENGGVGTPIEIS